MTASWGDSLIRASHLLHATGWQVIILWECQLKQAEFEHTMQKVVIALNENLLKQYHLK